MLKIQEAIINQVPGLCEQKIRKFVSLTLDVVKCKALFQSSINSSKEEAIMLGNAAKIIRKKTFVFKLYITWWRYL